MKFLLFSVLFIPAFVLAQNGKRDVLNPEHLEAKKFKLEAQKTASYETKLPFKNIRIIDSRFDTSKIGYVKDWGLSKRKGFQKMLLQGGISNAIESYYNEYYEGSFTQNDFELLIVMKRFWISGNAHSNNKRVEVSNSIKDNNSIQCKWEYYIGKNGNYLPVKRIDTTFRINEDSKNYLNDEFSEKRLYYLKQSLHALIEILDYSNAIDQFDKQPKKTLIQIEEFNKRMNMIPILQDSGFRKGVYLSFDDFKNNRPSITDFQEKKMHYGTLNANTEIYLEDKKGQTISNYWGYSNGKDFRYGMLGNDKIYKIQNTFCFFIKVVGYNINQGNDVPYGSPLEGGKINTISKDKYEIWIPFQIDMETGMIY
jgi:hypothetical protein